MPIIFPENCDKVGDYENEAGEHFNASSSACILCLQWDEALQTMTKGEKAEIVIQPEWAYGKKGLEGKYPFWVDDTQ